MNWNQQRTNEAPNPVAGNPNIAKVYLTGVYVRLSVEDGGLGKESESLLHQEQFLMRYLEQHPELILTKIYRDNGETGTKFDRPGFSMMMDDLRHGAINCILVKDLSRFGRDYVQTGEYIEKIFPFMGTRFISVLEDFDNIRPNARDTLMVNLKNLMNEAYAKDKSKRICSAFDAKRANGEFNVKYAPYGYLLSGDKKHPYVINPETADVVREIFNLRQQRMPVRAIARLLDEKGYLTPRQYAIKVGIRKKPMPENHWTSVAVYRILENPAYLGHMVVHKTEARLYQGIKKRKVDKKDQLFVPNVNEAIITQEQFDSVQGVKKVSKRSSKKQKAKTENLFRGFLYCAECGRPLYAEKSKLANGKEMRYYHCPTYRDHHEKYCSHKAGMREDKIKMVVLDFIKSQARLAGEIERRANSASLFHLEGLNGRSRKDTIHDLEAALDREEYLLKDAFECYVLGSLSESDYLFSKAKREKQMESLRAQLKKAKKNEGKGILEMVKSSSHVQILKSLTRARTVTREMCEALLERIDIDKDHNLKITVKYRDEFADLLQKIGDLEAEIHDVG